MTQLDLLKRASGRLRRRREERAPSGPALGSTFNRIWAALTISLIGSEITVLAIPLIAAVTLKATPFEMGVVSAASSLPFLLFSLPTGVFVDRLPRKKVMVATDLVSAVILVSIPLAWLFDAVSIVQVSVVAFGVGTCAVFFQVAHYAFVPAIVPGDRLVDANGRLQVSYSASDYAGPGVAGAMIQVMTAPLAVVVDALSFVASALLLGSLKEGALPVPEEERPTLRQALVDGLRFLLYERMMQPIMLLAGLCMIFNSALTAVTVLYFVRGLGLNPLTIGVLLAIGGIGAIPGAALARWSGERFGVGLTIIGGWAVWGASGVAIPLMAGPKAFVIVILGLTTAGGAMAFTAANIQQWTLRQLLAPQSLGGRVTAGYRFMVQGMGVIGAASGGYVAGLIGLRPSLVIYAIGGALVPLLGLLTPLRELKTLPPSVNTPEAA
ncbi:MFS transporter [Streptomyces sp. 7N604]|uniref:MFS transporter n=1 Tax=Streptomyces sp. 7N604 TaxID=3457415 RepID=UPI003FCF98CA